MQRKQTFVGVYRFALTGVVVCRATWLAPAAPGQLVRVAASAPHGSIELPDGLTDSTIRQFETGLAAICDSEHVAIVVEGVPLKQSLSDDELKDLKHSLLGRGSASPSAIVSRIASAYDYESKSTGSRTFLLRKRYSDPNDLPCVTGSEVEHALKSILNFVDPDSSDRVVTGKDSACFTFFDSLTADQKAHGHEGLKLADLSFDQQRLALAAAREALLHAPFMFVWDLLHQLQMLPDKRSVFTWMKLPEGEAFGYQGPFRPDQSIRRLPLNNGFTAQIGGAYTHTKIRLVSPAPPQPARSPVITTPPENDPTKVPAILPDPAAPSDLDRFLAPGMLSGRLPSTLTLAEFSEQITHESGAGASVSLDSAIAEKPICLYGQSYSDADHLIRSVAAIYDLQILTADDKHYFIALPRSRALDKPQDASAEIHRLIPSAILRYYSARSDAFRKAGDFSDSAPYRQKVADLAQKSFYYPAVRRLLALAEPAVPTPESAPVTVASVGPEASRLIGLAMLSGPAMLELTQLENFMPPRGLAEPDLMVVHVQANVLNGGSGQQAVNVIFVYPDYSGEQKIQGFGTTRKVTPPE